MHRLAEPCTGAGRVGELAAPPGPKPALLPTAHRCEPIGLVVLLASTPPLGLDLSRSAASRRLQPRRPGLPPGAPGYRRRLPGTGRAGAGPLLTSAGARAHDDAGDALDIAVYAVVMFGGGSTFCRDSFRSNFMGSRPPPRAGILIVLSFVPRTVTCRRHVPVRADPWLPSRPAPASSLHYWGDALPPEARCQ